MMAGVATHRFTVDDYHRMAQTEILSPGRRFELLDGEVIDVSPAKSPHAAAVSRLTATFAGEARERYIVRVQLPLWLNDFSEPEPDIAIVRARPDFYRGQHPVPLDVLLLIEVADSSLRYDREIKRMAYARAGIAEYWVVDLNGAKLHVYQTPSVDGYQSERVHQGGKIAPSAAADVQIDLELLLVR